MTEIQDIEQPFGGENLEVMRDAHNYNDYLRGLVRRYATDTSRVLDFGAGIGTFSDAPGTDKQRIHCVEPDETSRDVLTQSGFNAHESLQEIGDQTISFAFSLNVLEHIENDEAAVGELARVLRPGARLFIYVPAFSILFSSMDRHVGHVRRYRLRQLCRVVEGNGFRVEHAAYADFLGFFATLLFRLFDRSEPRPLNTGMIKVYDRFVFPLSRLLSIPFSRVLGKNVYVVARRVTPAAAAGQPASGKR